MIKSIGGYRGLEAYDGECQRSMMERFKGIIVKKFIKRNRLTAYLTKDIPVYIFHCIFFLSMKVIGSVKPYSLDSSVNTLHVSGHI